MNWYMVTFTHKGKVMEAGWMLAATDMELINYAQTMGYGIDIQYLGRADMTSVMPKILEG